jgi:hypothetical protein
LECGCAVQLSCRFRTTHQSSVLIHAALHHHNLAQPLLLWHRLPMTKPHPRDFSIVPRSAVCR